MTRCNTYVLVAAMAISGMGMSVHAADNSAPFNSDSTAQMQKTGGQMADESTAKSTRTALAKIVNDGVDGNKFSTLSSFLAKADRERMADVKNVNVDDLNRIVAQFRSDFKAKYNQEFDLSADQLQSAMVYAGQDKNSATVTIGRPNPNGAAADSMHATTATPVNGAMENNSSTNGATADRTLNTTGNDKTVSNRSGDMSGTGVTSNTAGNRTGPASNGENSNSTVRGNDTTATPGVASGTGNGIAGAAGTNSTTGNTDMANANMNNAASSNINSSMGSVGMSSVTLNLVNEGHVMNAWRISAPQLSAEQLKQNLVKHIQMLDDQKAAWPSDVNAAYQATAYHVLSAFSDNAVATER